MKILLFLFVFIIGAEEYAQNIGDYFLMIPDSVCLLNSKERRQFVDNYKAGKNEFMQGGEYKFWFEDFDIKNGYLKFLGAFEGEWEMCYWKLANGNKLIAVNQIGCGPICESILTFYEASPNKLKSLRAEEIIPAINISDCYDIGKIKLNNPVRDFEELEGQLYAAYTFKLPRTGKDIIVEFEPVEDFDTEKYKIYYKCPSNRIVLLWKDGRFTKAGCAR